MSEMKFNSDPEWLQKQAALEDGCSVSVGRDVSRGRHECEGTRINHYDVICILTENPPQWGLYDRWTHAYMWGVKYCPYCGTKVA
jgi:hypothetical protein